jgi:hypothetical protein
MAAEEPFIHCGWYMYRTPFVEMGDQLCLGDKLCQQVVFSFLTFVLGVCVCVCFGCYGDVLETVGSSEEGFNELKIKELGVIHHRLFWVCLLWWVKTYKMPIITSYTLPTN